MRHLKKKIESKTNKRGEEMVSKFVVNVEGAILKDDKWLIIRRSDQEEVAAGMLALVGGKVDADEDNAEVLEMSLKREILEEVNVIVEDKMHYVMSSQFTTNDGTHVVDVVFLCRYKSGQASCHSQEEVSQVMWFTTGEVLSHSSTPAWLKNQIKRCEEVRRSI